MRHLEKLIPEFLRADKLDYDRLVSDKIAKWKSAGNNFVWFDDSSPQEWSETEKPGFLSVDDPQVKTTLIDYYKGLEFGNLLEDSEFDQYRNK